MNFFKRPFVAVVLSALIVVCSTLVSVSVKLESKCDGVNDIFYEGVRISGVEYPAMAEPMKQLCALTDDIILIANNYGIDTGELSQRLDDLELAMQYSADDVSYIGSCYGEYFKALRTVENQLQSTGLSERHQAAMDEYSAQIETCSETIDQGAKGYNEKVRSFLKSYDKFPTSFWADVTGTWFPGYFKA